MQTIRIEKINTNISKTHTHTRTPPPPHAHIHLYIIYIIKYMNLLPGRSDYCTWWIYIVVIKDHGDYGPWCYVV